jgi:branched-chain amino acid transport system permease protein
VTASIVQVLLSGAQAGTIYGLLALSYYVILSASNILNFAQGEWMMIAAVSGVVLLASGIPYPLAVVLSIVLAMAISMLAERFIVRPLEHRGASLTVIILALFGVMIVVRYSTALVFGRQEEPLEGPLGQKVLALGDSVFLPVQSLVVYVIGAATFFGVNLFLHRTWLGRGLRVAAIDSLGAQVIGIDLNRVRFVAFGLGGLISAIVGWLYGPLYAAGYLIGAAPGIKGFIALFIGGMASPWGALVGGLFLGITEVAASRFLPSIYAEGLAFFILIVVLLLRPTGLLRRRTT